MATMPFKADNAQSTLDDPHRRLAQTALDQRDRRRRPEYGASLCYLKNLVRCWLDDFDWRAQERATNRFVHFRTDIDGIGIHFIDERGKGDQCLTIVLTHASPTRYCAFPS